MCGIAGEMSFGGPGSDADWQHISELMSRRGPDDQGRWSNERCTMVFRRLSILDLSPKGHQPMLSADGRYVMTFNGELYNYRELREQLKDKGRHFNSDGDSEVVLQSLIHWGRDALIRFNGMFAVALYDTHDHKLLLARDHAGIKPLYYLRTGQGVAYASQYNQILAHPWRGQCAIDQGALSLYLHFAYVPAPYAILENTHMLEPGSWVEIDARGSVTEGLHYQAPQFARPQIALADAVDAVDEAVTRSVRRQLVSDVPVAAFLSGGIDSPLVLSKMIGQTPEKLSAFTIGTQDSQTDESIDASRYAQELGVHHVLKSISEEDALALLDDVIECSGEPFGDYSIIPTMLVSRLASKQFKVILSGDGGDELFWGYVKRVVDILEVLPDFKRGRASRWLSWQMLKRFSQKDLSHLSFRDVGDLQAYKHLHLRNNYLPQIFPELPAWPGPFNAYQYSGYETDQSMQWLRWNELLMHLTRVLLKVDRASMHESIEVRVPLLDKEVMQTAHDIDWRACVDPQARVGKLPLRQSLARHLNHSTQAKRGFEVPMGNWLRGPLRNMVDEVLLSREEILGIPVNKKVLRQVFDRHQSGVEDMGRGLWPLLSLALWERKHFSP